MDGLIASAPEWLLALVCVRKPAPVSTTVAAREARPAGIKGLNYAERTLTAEARNVEYAGEGKRHKALFIAAARVGELAAYVNTAYATDVLTDAALAAGMKGREREIARTIRDGIKAGGRKPRLLGNGDRDSMKRQDRIDVESLRTFWQQCGRTAITDTFAHARELALTRFLALRRLWPPARIDTLDMLRVAPLPDAMPTEWWPPWFPKEWADDFRLASIALDGRGIPAGLAALSVNGGKGPPLRWARGCNPRGLYFANVHGAAVLRGKAPATLETVVITEGLERAVWISLQALDRPRPIAVLGVARQSFATLREVRLPAVPVLLDVDHLPDAHQAIEELRPALAGSDLRRRTPVGAQREAG